MVYCLLPMFGNPNAKTYSLLHSVLLTLFQIHRGFCTVTPMQVSANLCRDHRQIPQWQILNVCFRTDSRPQASLALLQKQGISLVNGSCSCFLWRKDCHTPCMLLQFVCMYPPAKTLKTQMQAQWFSLLCILEKHQKWRTGQAGDFLGLLEHVQLLKALAYTMWHSWHKQIFIVYAAKKTITYDVLLLLWVYSYPCFSKLQYCHYQTR